MKYSKFQWALRLIFTINLILFGIRLKNPYLIPFSIISLAIAGGFLLFLQFLLQKKNKAVRPMELSMGVACLAIALSFQQIQQVQFQQKKAKVLSADPKLIQLLGSHFIVGYQSIETLKPLVLRGAIAGIYLTQRNIQGKSIEAIRKEIDELQALQHQQGLPPLIVAVDQEGGMVSRMTPPLPYQSSLYELVLKEFKGGDSLEESAYQYGLQQGQGLKQLGVTVNLSPVVDLKLKSRAWFDFHTQIEERAISRDPKVVQRVAQSYCRGLEQAGIVCVLKHFPGLGRVNQDTHLFRAHLKNTDELRKSDWIAFRETLAQSKAWMMLGHVVLDELDFEHPSSISEKVIQSVIRQEWNYQGIVMTDDFAMGPIYSYSGGVGRASVEALNAGVDLILLSYDGELYYEAMSALIEAFERRELTERVGESLDRLRLWRKNF